MKVASPTRWKNAVSVLFLLVGGWTRFAESLGWCWSTPQTNQTTMTGGTTLEEADTNDAFITDMEGAAIKPNTLIDISGLDHFKESNHEQLKACDSDEVTVPSMTTAESDNTEKNNIPNLFRTAFVRFRQAVADYYSQEQEWKKKKNPLFELVAFVY